MHRPRAWPFEEPREPSRIYDLPPKGHKVDHAAPLRKAKVEAGLAKQGELLVARAKARTPKAGPEAFLDLELLTPRERRLKLRGV